MYFNMIEENENIPELIENSQINDENYFIYEINFENENSYQIIIKCENIDLKILNFFKEILNLVIRPDRFFKKSIIYNESIYPENVTILLNDYLNFISDDEELKEFLNQKHIPDDKLNKVIDSYKLDLSYYIESFANWGLKIDNNIEYNKRQFIYNLMKYIIQPKFFKNIENIKNLHNIDNFFLNYGKHILPEKRKDLYDIELIKKKIDEYHKLVDTIDADDANSAENKKLLKEKITFDDLERILNFTISEKINIRHDYTFIIVWLLKTFIRFFLIYDYPKSQNILNPTDFKKMNISLSSYDNNFNRKINKKYDIKSQKIMDPIMISKYLYLKNIFLYFNDYYYDDYLYDKLNIPLEHTLSHCLQNFVSFKSISNDNNDDSNFRYLFTYCLISNSNIKYLQALLGEFEKNEKIIIVSKLKLQLFYYLKYLQKLNLNVTSCKILVFPNADIVNYCNKYYNLIIKFYYDLNLDFPAEWNDYVNIELFKNFIIIFCFSEPITYLFNKLSEINIFKNKKNCIIKFIKKKFNEIYIDKNKNLFNIDLFNEYIDFIQCLLECINSKGENTVYIEIIEKIIDITSKNKSTFLKNIKWDFNVFMLKKTNIIKDNLVKALNLLKNEYTIINKLGIENAIDIFLNYNCIDNPDFNTIKNEIKSIYDRFELNKCISIPNYSFNDKDINIYLNTIDVVLKEIEIESITDSEIENLKNFENLLKIPTDIQNIDESIDVNGYSIDDILNDFNYNNSSVKGCFDDIIKEIRNSNLFSLSDIIDTKQKIIFKKIIKDKLNKLFNFLEQTKSPLNCNKYVFSEKIINIILEELDKNIPFRINIDDRNRFTFTLIIPFKYLLPVIKDNKYLTLGYYFIKLFVSNDSDLSKIDQTIISNEKMKKLSEITTDPIKFSNKFLSSFNDIIKNNLIKLLELIYNNDEFYNKLNGLVDNKKINYNFVKNELINMFITDFIEQIKNDFEEKDLLILVDISNKSKSSLVKSGISYKSILTGLSNSESAQDNFIKIVDTDIEIYIDPETKNEQVNSKTLFDLIKQYFEECEEIKEIIKYYSESHFQNTINLLVDYYKNNDIEVSDKTFCSDFTNNLLCLLIGFIPTDLIIKNIKINYELFKLYLNKYITFGNIITDFIENSSLFSHFNNYPIEELQFAFDNLYLELKNLETYIQEHSYHYIHNLIYETINNNIKLFRNFYNLLDRFNYYNNEILINYDHAKIKVILENVLKKIISDPTYSDIKFCIQENLSIDLKELITLFKNVEESLPKEEPEEYKEYELPEKYKEFELPEEYKKFKFTINSNKSNLKECLEKFFYSKKKFYSIEQIKLFINKMAEIIVNKKIPSRFTNLYKNICHNEELDNFLLYVRDLIKLEEILEKEKSFDNSLDTIFLGYSYKNLLPEEYNKYEIISDPIKTNSPTNIKECLENYFKDIILKRINKTDIFIIVSIIKNMAKKIINGDVSSELLNLKLRKCFYKELTILYNTVATELNFQDYVIKEQKSGPSPGPGPGTGTGTSPDLSNQSPSQENILFVLPDEYKKYIIKQNPRDPTSPKNIKECLEEFFNNNLIFINKIRPEYNDKDIKNIMIEMAERMKNKNIPSNFENLNKNKCFYAELIKFFTEIRNKLGIKKNIY